MRPEEAAWGLFEQLAAAMADTLNVLAWQNGGGKKKDYPKPIPRPGVTPEENKYGTQPVSIEEISDWLGW